MVTSSVWSVTKFLLYTFDIYHKKMINNKKKLTELGFEPKSPSSASNEALFNALLYPTDC
jgi:hypothetical protein